MEGTAAQTQETQAVVDRYLTAKAATDSDALEAILADGVERILPRTVWSEPVIGDRSDPTARASVITGKLPGEAQPVVLDGSTVKREFTPLIVSGDTAVVRLSLTATRLDGDRYDATYLWILTCANGQITRMEEWMDTLHMADQGILPFPGDKT